jgi:hypothetical protein
VRFRRRTESEGRRTGVSVISVIRERGIAAENESSGSYRVVLRVIPYDILLRDVKKRLRLH